MKLSALIKILQDTAEAAKRDGNRDPEVYVKNGAYLHEVYPMNARDDEYVRIAAGDSVGPDPIPFGVGDNTLWTD